MKNLKTFEEFLNESKNITEEDLNEFLKVDYNKIQNFLKDLKHEIKNPKLVTTINNFISAAIADPYSNYRDIMSNLEHYFGKEKEVMALVKKHVN